jgi:hypothetical protein
VDLDHSRIEAELLAGFADRSDTVVAFALV